MGCYFQSTVVRVGDEARTLIDGGVCILFAEPVPAELAEVSVIHAPEGGAGHGLSAGDVLVVGASRLTVTAVGDRAAENLRTLGHVVVYLDPEPDAALLPGALHATGRFGQPGPGDRIELHTAG